MWRKRMLKWPQSHIVLTAVVFSVSGAWEIILLSLALVSLPPGFAFPQIQVRCDGSV